MTSNRINKTNELINIIIKLLPESFSLLKKCRVRLFAEVVVGYLFRGKNLTLRKHCMEKSLLSKLVPPHPLELLAYSFVLGYALEI